MLASLSPPMHWLHQCRRHAKDRRAPREVSERLKPHTAERQQSATHLSKHLFGSESGLRRVFPRSVTASPSASRDKARPERTGRCEETFRRKRTKPEASQSSQSPASATSS